MTRINFHIFSLSVIVLSVLMTYSVMAEYVSEEGTLSSNTTSIVLRKTYTVLMYPTQTLFNLISVKGQGFSIFIIRLIFNILLYGLIIERLIFFFTFLKKRKTK
ncbi:hypothetical protein [Aquimarina algiphila]|uniref:hypothetical protein n=1 Tax=Aquimarina algiphila TaxID=2047982 RepID=UPI002490BBE6|nr:hypothetical protein [Aquimarina algiphila]